MRRDLDGTSLCRVLGLGEKGMASLVGAGGKTTLLYALARELAGEGKRVLVTTTTHMMAPLPQEVSAFILSPDPEEVIAELRGFPTGWTPIFAASHKQDLEGKMVGFSAQGVQRFWEEGFLDWVLVEADGAARRPLKAPAPHEPVVPPGSLWVVGLVGLDAVGKPLEEAWVFRWEIYGCLLGLDRGEEVTPDSVARLALHPEGLFKGAPPKAERILWLNKADMPGAESAGHRIISCIEDMGWGGLDRAVIGSALSRESFMACFRP